MIGGQRAGSGAVRSPDYSPAPGALTTMSTKNEALLKRIFCPDCKCLLLEACAEGFLLLRIKCRHCSKREKKPVIVTIEIKLATTSPPVVDSPPDP